MAKNDYTGKRFGHLVFIRPSQSGGPGVGAKWILRCDCGNEKEILVKNVLSGRTLTCGNCKYFYGLRRGGRQLSKGLRSRFIRAASRAQEEHKEWQISPEEFEAYMSGNCGLCGVSGNTNQLKLALLDTDAQYAPGTVTALCGECRQMQGDWPLEKFLYKLKQIYAKITLDTVNQ